VSAEADRPRAQLEGLARFAPVFSAPGHEFARWHASSRDASGVVTLGYCALGEEASAFQQMAYDLDLVLRFDWMNWAGGEEGCNLLADPSAVETADLDQLRKLLTVFIRQDRFCEGALAQAFDRGFITAICRRAAVLLRAMPA